MAIQLAESQQGGKSPANKHGAYWREYRGCVRGQKNRQADSSAAHRPSQNLRPGIPEADWILSSRKYLDWQYYKGLENVRRGILAEDHRSRTCPGPLAAPTGFEVQPPHRRRRSSAPRLLHGGGAHYSYFLEFLHPPDQFFRLIHAAYYHESIIVHIKPIFYNDIWAELTLPRSHKTRIIN